MLAVGRDREIILTAKFSRSTVCNSIVQSSHEHVGRVSKEMLCCCGMSRNSMPSVLQLTVTISVLRLLLPDSEVTAKTALVYNSSVHVVRAIRVCMHKYEQSTNHISLKNWPRCYANPPAVLNVFGQYQASSVTLE